MFRSRPDVGRVVSINLVDQLSHTVSQRVSLEHRLRARRGGGRYMGQSVSQSVISRSRPALTPPPALNPAPPLPRRGTGAGTGAGTPGFLSVRAHSLSSRTRSHRLGLSARVARTAPQHAQQHTACAPCAVSADRLTPSGFVFFLPAPTLAPTLATSRERPGLLTYYTVRTRVVVRARAHTQRNRLKPLAAAVPPGAPSPPRAESHRASDVSGGSRVRSRAAAGRPRHGQRRAGEPDRARGRGRGVSAGGAEANARAELTHSRRLAQSYRDVSGRFSPIVLGFLCVPAPPGDRQPPLNRFEILKR